MSKRLRDYLLEGGIKGKTFVDRRVTGTIYTISDLVLESRGIILYYRIYKSNNNLTTPFGNDCLSGHLYDTEFEEQPSNKDSPIETLVDNSSTRPKE